MRNWIEAQRRSGWPSYERAVYALVRLGVAWERNDQPPESPKDYMRAWYESSRRAGAGLAPEHVRDEIESA